MPNAEHDMEFLITQYVDGLLDPSRAAELERKLEADPALREQLRLYESLQGLLMADDRKALSGIDYDGQREEVIAAVQRRALAERLPSRPVILRPMFRVLAAAAAVLVVASVGLLVYRAGPRAEPEVSVAMRSAAVSPAGRGELEVSMRRVDPGMLAMSVLAPAAEGPLPSGTVVVSAGPQTTTPPNGTADGDVFFLAGIW